MFVRRILLALISLLCLSSAVLAQSAIHVPVDQPTIQAGIDAATDGDTVLVDPGYYNENLNFHGKAITVRAAVEPAPFSNDYPTHLMGNQVAGVPPAPTVIFGSAEGRSSVLEGFVIGTGGVDPSLLRGAGIYIDGASPTIKNNYVTSNYGCNMVAIFANNSAARIENNQIGVNGNQDPNCQSDGGGIVGIGVAAPTTPGLEIINNHIFNNMSSSGAGAGIYLSQAGTVTISGNRIFENFGGQYSGVFIRGSNVTLTNNLITQNGQGGLYVGDYDYPSVVVATSNTIADNNYNYASGWELGFGYGSTATFYNNIIDGRKNNSALLCQGGTSDSGYNDIIDSSTSNFGCGFQTGINGNVSVDPMFIGTLISTNNPPIYTLRPSSPLVDAGLNTALGVRSTDVDGNPRIVDNNNDGTATIDMGAFEYTPIVSFSPSSIDFGTVAGGSTLSSQVTVTALTPLTGLAFKSWIDLPQTISSAPPNPNDLSFSSNCAWQMNAGDTCTLNLALTPSSLMLSRYNILAFSSLDETAEMSITVQAQNTSYGVAWLNHSGSIDFGDLAYGRSVAEGVTLTNVGTGTLYLNSISASPYPFSAPNNCGSSLAPGTSCVINATFYANSYGRQAGSLAVQSWDSQANAYTTQAIALNANVVASTLSGPANVNFGLVKMGTTATQSITITNASTIATTIYSISPNPSGADFSQTNTCGSQVSAGGSCTVSFAFSPSTRSAESTIYSIYSSAQNSPLQIQVSGTGGIVQFSTNPASTSYSLGNVLLGSQATRTVQLMNTGDLALGLTSIGISGTDYTQSNNCPQSLAAGSSCNVTAVFAPVTRATETAVLAITSDAPNSPLSISFSGRGIVNQMQVSPASIGFGSKMVNSSNSLPVVISNTGDLDINLGGAITIAAPFQISGNSCPAPLPAGQQCTVTVLFAPTARGSFSGQLNIAPGAPNNFTIPITATAVQPIESLSATSLAFGDQQVNTTSAAQPVIITNTGDAVMTFQSISISGNGFTSASNCGATLQPQGSCTVNVYFDPTTSMSYGAKLTIATDAPFVDVSLSGRGVVGTPMLSVSSQNFGNQKVGTVSASTAITLSNSGSSALDSISISLSGAFQQTNNCTGHLAPSASCTVYLSFAPVVAGASNGTLTVTTNGNPATVNASLTGNGTTPAASVSATSLPFGNVLIGSIVNKTITMTNTGDGAMTISAISVSGSGFTLVNGCPTSLAPGSSCNLTVTFQPMAHTTYAGTVIFQDDSSGSPQSVGLSGSGVAPTATLSTSSIGFGNVQVGDSSSNSSLTLTNNGDTALNISGVQIYPAAFTQANNCGASLGAGASCTISISFAPTASGAYSGNLVISDNASSNSQTISLSGNGVIATAVFSPSALTFGSYTVGTTTSASNISLINSGNEAMNISSIATTGDFIQSNNCPASLAYGASCTISVKFKPTAGGTRSGSLVLSSSNVQGGVASVALLGTGIDFALSTTPSALTVARKASATITVNLTSIGGTFPSSISLSCTGLPGSTTCGFSPSSVAAGGTSSTLTIKEGATAPVGTYAITVKGTSGTQTRTAIVTLTIQ